MAVTQNSYIGNGSTTTYSFTFPYLKASDVKASIDAVDTTAFTLPTATTLQFNTAPSNGAKIKIFRETATDNLTATFYAGSAIKSEDLNENFTQNLYSTQEISTRYLSNLGGTMVGNFGLGEDADIVFEGATDNTNETTLTVADPTADRTITFPDTTGTVVTTGDTGTVTSTMLADGTIVAADLASNSVTTAKITDANVTTAKIAADAVTGAKIADDQINSEHYVAGSIDTEHIANSQITNAKMADNSVNTAELVDDAVTAAKLASNSVVSASIVDGSIATADIADNAITNAKMADDSVGAAELVDTSVGTAALASNAVTNAKMADASVGTSELVNDAVTTVKIANSQVTTAKIADSNVTTAKINNDAVTSAKIADNAIGNEHLQDDSVRTAEIQASAVTTAKIADDAVTNAKIADSAVNNAQIANNAVNVYKLANDAVSTPRIAANAVTADKIASNAVTTDKISDAELTTLAGMQSGTASILASSTALTATTTELNQLDGKTIQTTVADNDAQLPTSGAIVDYVAAQIAPLGGLEVIATEVAFPNTQPASGVVISISDAGGIVVNGSGVSTTGRTVGGSTVTINGFPSSVQSSTLAASMGLMVSSTGSSQTYTYHKLLGKESDITALSDDINDFNNRYRVSGSAPTSSLDNGDLWFDTANGKMMVYNGTSTAWEEVSAVGSFNINTLSSSGNTGGGSATFNGTAYRFTLSNPPQDAQQLLVSINGVVQKPNSGSSQPSEGFAISGNDIIFSAAPASGSISFIVTLGQSVQIGTPSDNTISTAKIQNLAVTTDKIADDAVTAAKLASGVTDLSNDTSPQLGGTLDTNGNLITFGDSSGATDDRLKFGVGADLNLYHDGSNSYIENKTADLYILTSGGLGDDIIIQSADNISFRVHGTDDGMNITGDGSVELYYDNSKKFQTSSEGVDVVSGNLTITDNYKARFGASLDLQIYHNGSHSYIENSTGTFVIRNTHSGQSIKIQGVTGEQSIVANGNGAVELYYDNSQKFTTDSNGFYCPNNGEYIAVSSNGQTASGRFGYHENYKLYIENVRGAHTKMIWDNDGKIRAQITDGSNLQDRLVVTASGTTLTGLGNTTLTINTGNNSGDNSQLAFGDTADANVGSINYDHGTNAMQFTVNASERLRVDSSGHLQFRTASTSHQGLEWYYNNSKNLSFTIGDNNANATLNIFRADAQTGFPYGNLIINTGDGTNPTQALKLRTDKNIELAGNLIMASGKGIDFSATSDASGKTSELLDDYEEGSWTPVPEFGGSITGATYQIANCQYTKIGRQVNIKGNINFSSRGSSTGAFKITGLPFADAYAGSYSHSCGAAIVFHGPNADGSMTCFTSSSNEVRFRMHNEANDNQEPQHSDFDNDTKIMFSITYFTS